MNAPQAFNAPPRSGNSRNVPFPAPLHKAIDFPAPRSPQERRALETAGTFYLWRIDISRKIAYTVNRSSAWRVLGELDPNTPPCARLLFRQIPRLSVHDRLSRHAPNIINANPNIPYLRRAQKSPVQERLRSCMGLFPSSPHSSLDKNSCVLGFCGWLKI